MNAKAIEMLLLLKSEQKDIKGLAKSVGLSYVRASQLVSELIQQGFAIKVNGLVALAQTAHGELFKKISRKFDPKKLLADSTEEVAIELQNSNNLKEIEQRTGFSYWTIRRSLVNLMQIGAVREEKGGKYHLAQDEELRFFLELIEEERLKKITESYAEVIYSDQNCLLKRVPQGKHAEGSLTAFSVFWKYGIELNTVFQYFVQPAKNLAIEEILVHSLVFSATPVERTDCALFYSKNRDSIDLDESRELAKKFGVQDMLVDLKAYVSRLTIPVPERFLPWNEFAEKARLYGFSPENLVPPPAYPDFVLELAQQVDRPAKVFAFGGEAMRIRDLKRATKDVDLVVEDSTRFQTLSKALHSLGYRQLQGREISKLDAKLDPSGIFVNKVNYPRIDIFVRTICGKFKLSNGMKTRSSCENHDRLDFCIMSNEDIFLLKSITDREGDIYDMIELARASNFRWEIVLEELYNQEQKSTGRYCFGLLDSVKIIQERTGIKAPFLNKLENHCIDHAILDLVNKWKITTMAQIKDLINYPDYRLRSRVEKLVKDNKLVKRKNKLARP
jgi:predicted transcriptional regulator